MTGVLFLTFGGASRQLQLAVPRVRDVSLPLIAPRWSDLADLARKDDPGTSVRP